MASSEKTESASVIPQPELERLASELKEKWQILGRTLGISDAHLHNITENNKGNLQEAKYQMLSSWKQTKGREANYKCLAEALVEVGRRDLAEKLQSGFNRSVHHPSPSTTPDLQGFNRNAQHPSPSTTLDLQGMKEQFLQDIKDTYEYMYNRVQPVTYIKERCVNNVFIDSGMEYLSKEGRSKVGRETWHKLDSYNSIFIDPRLSKAMVYVLLGEPGYGKSTLVLQYAYDWCNRCPDSPLKDVEMLIFLRLRYLRGGMPIFKAIKQLLLPHGSALSEGDISGIIQDCKSVVIIFDGLDEYASQSNEDDVMKVLARQMLKKCKVVLTTRPSSTPPILEPDTEHVRLTGLDDQARERYVLKAVVDGDSEAAAKILQQLQQSPVFADTCQVCLFFVIFAHMTHEGDMSVVIESVTCFFRYVVSSFSQHKQIRAGKDAPHAREVDKAEYHKLYKFAFESLKGKDKELVWRREAMMEQIGELLYNELIEIGVLVEENVMKIEDAPGTSAADHVQRWTNVSFHHKLLCEWYAAHYVADFVASRRASNWKKFFARSSSISNLKRFFKDVDPADLQYVYRIACGLNPAAAEKIIQYLHSIKGGDKFAILCILEQTGDVDKIKGSIREICRKGVFFNVSDSLLLQRSTLQLLDIAARYEIPIKHVSLSNCFQSVDLSTSAIRTTSGLALTSRIPVKKLSVNLSYRDMTEDEFIDILQFASMCPSLRELRYVCRVPPQRMVTNMSLSSLKSRDVEVRWDWWDDSELSFYILNLQTGRWENAFSGSELTKEDYERMMEEYREEVRKHEEKLAASRAARKKMRKKAELRGEALD